MAFLRCKIWRRCIKSFVSITSRRRKEKSYWRRKESIRSRVKINDSSKKLSTDLLSSTKSILSTLELFSAKIRIRKTTIVFTSRVASKLTTIKDVVLMDAATTDDAAELASVSTDNFTAARNAINKLPKPAILKEHNLLLFRRK
jgi:hypothetical protein